VHPSREVESINYAPQMPYPISVSNGLYHYLLENTVTLKEMMEMADQEIIRRSLVKSEQAI
jgi:hypothetical protein